MAQGGVEGTRTTQGTVECSRMPMHPPHMGDMPEQGTRGVEEGQQQQQQTGSKRKMQEAIQGGDDGTVQSHENLVGKFKRVHLIEHDLIQDEDTALDSDSARQMWGNTMYIDVNKMLGDAHRDMLQRTHQGL